jgi:hypothetical protein
MRASGWTATSFDNGNGYRELDQDPGDTTLCGDRSDGYAFMWTNSGVPPVVGQGLNGYSAVQHTSGQGAFFFGTGDVKNRLAGKRFGGRYYAYFSDSDSCMSAKFIQIGAYWSSSGMLPDGTVGLLWQGDGTGVPGFKINMFRNKWHRIEVYQDSLTNAWTDPVSQTIILKNITDNGPEYKVTVTGNIQYVRDGITGFNNWIHQYRDQRILPGPACTTKYSFLLVGKNLSPGERIQPAVEIEGNVPAPAPSADLTPPTVSITSPVAGAVIKVN